MKKHLFLGCATALITPFTEDNKNVDYEAFEKLISYQLENNIDALVVSGTTGESPVLSEKEKESLFETAVSFAGNKIPVIAGTGSNDTEKAVRLSNTAERKGVNGLLIVTPFYNKCTQEGIIKHYFYIADRVSTPIIVYNVPSRTGLNIAPETYAELSQHKNICGIKEANGDISSVAKTLSLCGNNIDLYSGNDDQTVPIMALGGKGIISVASNIIPDIIHALTNAMLNKNFDKAKEIQLEYLELINMLFCETNPIPVKYAAEMLFNKKCPLRLPLTKLSAQNREKLSALMKAYSLI